MTIRAIVLVQNVYMNTSGNLVFLVRVATPGSGYENVEYGPVATDIAETQLKSDLAAWGKQYASDTFGVTFDVLDTVRVFGVGVASL